MAITARPVGATKPGVGQAHPGTQHNNAEGNNCGDHGKLVDGLVHLSVLLVGPFKQTRKVLVNIIWIGTQPIGKYHIAHRVKYIGVYAA